MRSIVIGSDHAGFEVKENIWTYLSERGYGVEDVGTDSLESADYPVYAGRVARHVQITKDLGILLCGSGIGMSIAASKYEGVYAARCVNAEEARKARISGANVLCLRGSPANFEKSKAIVDAFLATEFSEEERHTKRLKQMDELARQPL